MVSTSIEIHRTEIICRRILTIKSVILDNKDDEQTSTDGKTALGTSSPPYPNLIDELPMSTTIPPVSSTPITNLQNSHTTAIHVLLRVQTYVMG